jgi:hypothetical protein
MNAAIWAEVMKLWLQQNPNATRQDQMFEQIADHMNEIFPVLVLVFVVLPLCIGWAKASRNSRILLFPGLVVIRWTRRPKKNEPALTRDDRNTRATKLYISKTT